MARTKARQASLRTASYGKATLLAVIGLVLVPVALLEAASQLPGGRASPIQLPVLTTAATVNISAQQREQLARGTVPERTRARLVRVSAERLASEPLDPTALWLWSLGQPSGKARQALDLADKVSRRERSVQLELMRLKALEGNLPESLAHLDNVLTVTPKAAPLLLKNLAVGLDQPQLVRLLKPYEQRPWYKELLEQAVNHAPRPENTAQLLLQGNLSPASFPANFLPNIVSRLVQVGNLRTAETIVSRYTPMGPKAMKQFAPTPQTMMQGARPLSWELFNDTNVISEPVTGGVAFDVEPGLGGTLMARITGFTPGTYTLRQTVKASSEDLRITWRMQCLSDKVFRQTWLQPLPASGGTQRYQTNIEIAPDCVVQRWELSATNQSGTDRAAVEVTGLDLLR